VKEEQVAAQAVAFSGFPGNLYPNLFMTLALPAAGKTADDVEVEVLGEIERLREDLVSEDELRKVKTRARASLIRGLSSNMGMARNLAFYEHVRGDWRDLFRQVERIEEVTAEDVQRVARKYLTRKNRTTTKLVKTVAEEPSE
jgi:predicted Zn-dependent peptidase